MLDTEFGDLHDGVFVNAKYCCIESANVESGKDSINENEGRKAGKLFQLVGGGNDWQCAQRRVDST